MTGIDRQGGTPKGPPWSVDVLADLHADALDEAEAARLWPLVRADRDASAIIAALDNTRSELRGLADMPAPPMPTKLADRLDAAIAAESKNVFGSPSTPAPVADMAARRRRNRRLGLGAGILAVAAAAAAIALVSIPGSGNGGPGNQVANPPGGGANGGGPAQALTHGDLNANKVGTIIGHSDLGPLTDQHRLAGCLAANGQDPERTPLGASQVVFEGRPGTLLVLPTGRLAQYRLLIVGPACAAGHADTVNNTVVGGVPPTQVPPGH